MLGKALIVRRSILHTRLRVHGYSVKGPPLEKKVACCAHVSRFATVSAKTLREYHCHQETQGRKKINFRKKIDVFYHLRSFHADLTPICRDPRTQSV
jgi:hypothetical protein